MLLLSLTPPQLIALVFTLIVSLSVHECAHAWTAVELGDDTPRFNGRLTLNPLAHLDLIGSLMFIVVGFGWAKPVPVNPYNFRNVKRDMAIVSLAGPFANFTMALLAAIPLRLGLMGVLYTLSGESILIEWAAAFLSMFIFLNLSLMVFNLIPLGPLDGAKVLRGIAPHAWDAALLTLERWGMFILLAFMLLGNFGGISIFSLFLSPLVNLLYSAIVGR